MYLAMGKSKAAIRDLSKVVELKQDFTSVSITGIEDCSSVKKKTASKKVLYFFQTLLNRNREYIIPQRALKWVK